MEHVAALGRAQAVMIREQGATIARLEDRVAELEDALGAREAVAVAWLTPSQRAIFGLLLRGRSVTRAAISAVLWGGRPECDRPQAPNRVIDVQVHRLRRALHARGVVLVTVTGAKRDIGDAWFLYIPADMLPRARAMAVGEVPPS